MENAAQALIIAGSMMLAVLLISILLLVRQKMSEPVEQRENFKQMEQIENFNRIYLVYNQKLLQGSDVLSVLTRAYDHAISLEPIIGTEGSKNHSRTRKEGAKVNEPLVDVEIRFKDKNPSFSMQLSYESARFDGDVFMGRDISLSSRASFGGKKIGEILGISSTNSEINELLTKTTLEGAKEINYKLSSNTIHVFTKESRPDGNLIIITNEINDFINYGGNSPSITKKNSKITKQNNWLKLHYTTPAADFIRKSFRWVNEEQYNEEGYITKVVFEEI